MTNRNIQNSTEEPVFTSNTDKMLLEESNDLLKSSESTIAAKAPRGVVHRRINRRVRYFRPIIMMFVLALAFPMLLNAQLTGFATLTAGYTDNVFQLSDYDMDRFDRNNSKLSYVDTTDDASLSTRIELGYPINYRWWKFTPKLGGTITQNLSNTDKYRRDANIALSIDRYYWDMDMKYTYSPYIYYRHFEDSDGTDELEKYSYSRNQYELSGSYRLLKSLSLNGKLSMQDLFYNEFFTEADGRATSYELGAAYRFPIFTLNGAYAYKEFDNDTPAGEDDSSYESNIYKAKLTLQRMPLSDTSTTTWQPYLGINYEQRYFQGTGDLYNARADYIYTLSTGFGFRLSSTWNLSLDYAHLFRNVESSSSEVLRLKEFSENRLSTTLRYNF